jgi:hypothetical protein
VKLPTRQKIEKTVDTAPIVVEIGSRKIVLRRSREHYEIVITVNGEDPNLWTYKKKSIAIDRFEEQVAYFRRSSQ